LFDQGYHVRGIDISKNCVAIASAYNPKMSHGTAYAIRVPTQLVELAYEAGCTSEQTWTYGGKTRIEEEFGHGWVFGACFLW
jgi:hypothetical protein